jgi:hypothetical protein
MSKAVKLVMPWVLPGDAAIEGEEEADELWRAGRTDVAAVAGLPVDVDDALQPPKLWLIADADKLLEGGVKLDGELGGSGLSGRLPK